MTRKDLEAINNDREVINLRMQAEDLINNIEAINDDVYMAEAMRIQKGIKERITYLCQQLKQ